MNAKNAAVASAVAALGLAPIAQAQTLDFEDLTAGTNYDAAAGDTIVTDGVTITLDFFNFSGSGGESSGGAFVLNPNGAGSGNGIGMGNTNLNFQFAFPLTTVGFSYAESGGNVNLIVNGALFNSDDMSLADGTVLGGANVAVAGDESAGVVTITGVINEFKVGGQEFEVDDVRFVPTPGVAAVLGLGGLAATRRRR